MSHVMAALRMAEHDHSPKGALLLSEQNETGRRDQRRAGLTFLTMRGMLSLSEVQFRQTQRPRKRQLRGRFRLSSHLTPPCFDRSDRAISFSDRRIAWLLSPLPRAEICYSLDRPYQPLCG